MEEIKDLIKQEDYEKYKKILQEFECKAIDIIEDLTYQFKETLAEEIDDKIKGWKKDNERILRENWEKDDKIKQLEQELAELKEKDNYHLRYELAGADETITNLKRQLEEKDKDKTQLAIQELEKVKEEFGLKSGWSSETDMCFDLEQFINQQIKELKGEKDDI